MDILDSKYLYVTKWSYRETRCLYCHVVTQGIAVDTKHMSPIARCCSECFRERFS